ncbi:MAG TPA: hypothetical protein VKB93_03945 [Thermoanaerobaculia bacterium]|nr:hypothetical protein [Thermoanaerobaculia bacterium]
MRRQLSGFALALLAVLVLTNPITRVMIRQQHTPSLIAVNGFLAPLEMLCVVAGVLAVSQILRSRADKAGLIGAALTIMGWAAGIRIIGLGQLESLLASGVTGVPPDTLTRMFQAAPIVWISIVPFGLMYPIGLITLGATIVFARPVPRWIGALMIAGGALFPVGRIGAIFWAIAASDLLLGATFALLAWQILTRPELRDGRRDAA